MRCRITIGIMFIIFILFIIFAHVAITEQRTRMLQQVETYGAEVTRFIAQISIVPLKKFNIYYLENYAFQFEQGELIAFCHIYDEKDNLLTVKEGEFVGDVEVSRQGTTDPVRTFTADIVENGIHYGRVDVGLYVGSVYTNINRTSFYIILAFCIAVVVIGGAVSFFIHRQFVRPILKLSKTTRTIAQGQFVTSDISLRKDEIGELAGAINLMSGNLEESYRTLEKKVDERMVELIQAKDMAEKSNRHLQIVGEEVQALLDNSPVGIVFVTNDYKILRVNREFFKITGYEAEEIIGESTRILHKDSHSFDEFIRSSNPLDEDGLFNKKTELQKKDGLTISCAVRGRKTILAGGAQGIVLNFEDITSRLLIEEELLKIRKLESVGVLARGIAHDFNNILVAILGNLSLIERFTENDKQVGKLLSEARKASLRAKDLTEKLLTFAKGSEPDVKIGKLSDILRKSVPLALVGSTISSDYDIEDGLWKVKVDKSQIDSVVQSIVLNAKESMGGEGVITICCRNQELSESNITSLTKGKYVKITISDTGSGIDSNVIDKIFDPYFSTKEKDSNKGSGLGLSIVRSILVKHKGAIFMESEPGKGSLVTVYLPAVADAVSVKKAEQILPSGKGLVVVADENHAAHELTQEMLSYLGYQYVACYSLEDIVQEVEGVGRDGKHNVIVLIASTLIRDMAKQNIMDMFNSFAADIRYIVYHEEDPGAAIDEYLASGFDNDLKKPFQLLELSRVLSSTTKRA
ncbi:MAG: two-component system cell cycle sensor histidine kinase/response regulator CckA [Desulforhopalus sp.]|jgi:two-component system cell cycle sensor histidine kinase/response regulator CckA